MRKLPFYHAFTAKSHEPLIELSEMLIQRAPVPMSKVIFANSGSEANDTAIKMIWYFNNALGRTAKKKIIGRIKGYHGITAAAASLTGLPANHRSFDVPLPGFIHTTTPHFYHGATEGETEEDFATRCAADLEALILAEGPDTVAAMFAEPIMGAGGVILPPEGLFRENPGGSEEVRRAAGRRRGDLRVRPHRQLLGLADAGRAAGHHHLREGAVGKLPADLGHDGERAGVPGAGPRKATRSARSATATPIPATRCRRRWRSRR